MDELRKFEKAMGVVRDAHSEFTARQLSLFLKVVQDPGITQSELGEKLDLLSGIVSRNLKTLSRYMEDGKLKGLDLVEMKPDLHERRKLAVFPTSKGKELVETIKRALG